MLNIKFNIAHNIDRFNLVFDRVNEFMTDIENKMELYQMIASS